MKTLIFDAGGVQVWPLMGEWHVPVSLPRALGERAGTMKTERFRQAQRDAFHWLEESQLVKDLDAERALRLGWTREMNQRMDWALTDAQIDALADDFTYNVHRYGFYDDVVPWLERWKGHYRLGVLSDAMPSIYSVLDAFGALPLFEHVVISTHVGATKPDARMFRAVIDAFGARPEDCLFVDDNPANVEAACAQGMKGAQMARAEFMPPRLWNGPVARDFAALDGLLDSIWE